MNRTSQLMIAVIAAALVVTACGGDTADTTATPTTTTVAPTTTVPPTTAPLAAPSAESEWCDLAQEIAQSPAFDNLAFVSPEENERNLTEFSTLLEEAAEIAPAEIADSVATSLDAFLSLIDALAGHGYDFVALLDDPDALTILDDAAAEAAGDAIAEYNERECGIANDTSDDDDGDLSELIDAGGISGIFVQSLVDEGFTEEEATCIGNELDLTTLATAGLDPEQLAAVMAMCLTPERIEEFGGTPPP